ncbi:MAG TPA: hypothetical protein V6D08_14540 [Candidatus Obscuribacterales bacterium]
MGQPACWIAGVALAGTVTLVLLDLLITRSGMVPWEFLREMFDLGVEGNVPTWFASVLWLLAAAASIACYLADRRLSPSGTASRIWLFMSLTFLYVSVDEVATIHEEVGSFLKEQVRKHSLGGIVPFGSPDSPWIVFYLPIMLAFLGFMLVFLWRKLGARKWLKLALVLVVECYLCAIALDYFQGLEPQVHRMVAYKLHARPGHLVDATIVAEEALELVGTSVLIAVLTVCAQHALEALPGASSGGGASDSSLPTGRG